MSTLDRPTRSRRGRLALLGATVLCLVLTVVGAAIGVGIGITRLGDEDGEREDAVAPTAGTDSRGASTVAAGSGAGSGTFVEETAGPGAGSRDGGKAGDDVFPPFSVPAMPLVSPAAFLAPPIASAPTPLPAPMPGTPPLSRPAPAPAEDAVPDPAPMDAPAPDPIMAPSPTTEDALEPAELAPAPAPAQTAAVQPLPDGTWLVCVDGSSQTWDSVDADDAERPCGVRVFADGRVQLGEYFGGFDGFFSTDPANGHETCFNRAVAEALGEPICRVKAAGTEEHMGEEEDVVECLPPAEEPSCACVATVMQAQRDWPGNVGVQWFMEQLLKMAKPVDYDPDVAEDREAAESGGRVANQKLVEAAFAKMITVQEC